MLIVEMTSKRMPSCLGCAFAVETEDGHVYCGNRDCVFYLRTTTCKCELRELPIIDETETAESKEN